MPAAFQIVSRASQKALAIGDPNYPHPGTGDYLWQLTQNNQDPTQMWVLAPQEFGNFLIQPFSFPDLAIGVGPPSDSDDTAFSLSLGPVAQGQIWTISPIPPYYFLIVGSEDLLMDVPGGSHDDFELIQVFQRTEHANQQWTFLPIFAQLRNDG
jgi:hypothetical protein